MTVTFTESLIDSGIRILVESLEERKANFDKAIKFLIIYFAEGMIWRDWIRNKIEGLQTDVTIKNIVASSVSKMAAEAIYNYTMNDPIDFKILKYNVFTATGTAIIGHFFKF